MSKRKQTKLKYIHVILFYVEYFDTKIAFFKIAINRNLHISQKYDKF